MCYLWPRFALHIVTPTIAIETRRVFGRARKKMHDVPDARSVISACCLFVLVTFLSPWATGSASAQDKEPENPDVRLLRAAKVGTDNASLLAVLEQFADGDTPTTLMWKSISPGLEARHFESVRRPLAGLSTWVPGD
jgi:hypothetical protein